MGDYFLFDLLYIAKFNVFSTSYIKYRYFFFYYTNKILNKSIIYIGSNELKPNVNQFLSYNQSLARKKSFTNDFIHLNRFPQLRFLKSNQGSSEQVNQLMFVLKIFEID